MSELTKVLVALYAGAPVDTVHEGADYRELCEEHAGDRAFDAERHQVHQLRVRIDKQLAGASSHRHEVELALRMLRNPTFRRNQEKREICRELIVRSYGRAWAQEQHDYFERWANVVSGAQDYFLSFTNRNPSRPAQNPVNRDHRHFISDTLGPKGYSESELVGQNLVARCVRNLLAEKGLEGFYYPDHAENNKVVVDQLSEQCARSLAFVQLIQRAMFDNDPKGNWCHFEYRAAREGGADTLFVQIEDDLVADGIDLDFEDWVADWVQRGTVKLEWSRAYTQDVIEGNFLKVRKGLVESIRGSVDRIYLGIPQ